ncbi:MAG TPA: HAD-IIB family hydrolase [Vicinamibacteria bacterium]|nr:HAD-IIB family hydrolase [Vicinamibacteria bacterium]
MAADLLVVTDLDGCLLDEQTYGYDAARPALASLAERRIPLVLCSSKTRAEVQPLARELGAGPFIVENGGAIVVPPGHLLRLAGRRDPEGYRHVVLGTGRDALVRALAELAEQAGARVRGFSSLGAEDVAALTGLAPPAAERALQREFDEPFLLESGSEERLARAATGRGLRITRGGRFHHLLGPVDKGRALQRLIALYAAEGFRFTVVALGDSPNDLSMLKVADRPILMPRPDGAVDETLRRGLPRAAIAPAPGPAGWNVAVLATLAGVTGFG